MEGDWESAPGVSAFFGVKILKVVEEGLLVTEMEVHRKLVVDLDLVSSNGLVCVEVL
jgi:ActR/RegA family two-component response regulator